MDAEPINVWFHGLRKQTLTVWNVETESYQPVAVEDHRILNDGIRVNSFNGLPVTAAMREQIEIILESRES